MDLISEQARYVAGQRSPARLWVSCFHYGPRGASMRSCLPQSGRQRHLDFPWRQPPNFCYNKAWIYITTIAQLRVEDAHVWRGPSAYPARWPVPHTRIATASGVYLDEDRIQGPYVQRRTWSPRQAELPRMRTNYEQQRGDSTPISAVDRPNGSGELTGMSNTCWSCLPSSLSALSRREMTV